MVRFLFFICGLMWATSLAAANDSGRKVLRVYGPGGPHQAMADCARLFHARHGLEVKIIKAKPHELDRRVAKDGDIFYAGAECMLREFDERNPGVLDMTSVELLYPRRVGIIVRKGNPQNVNGTFDLGRKGIDILDVKLENMRQFYSTSNVRKWVYTGKQGIETWHSTPWLDAWVTYRSWHRFLEGEAEFIELAGPDSLRFTPLALTKRTPLRQEAQLFIDFLKSEEAQQIFARHGWE